MAGKAAAGPALDTAPAGSGWQVQTASLFLIFRHSDDKAVELLRNLNLAAQAAIGKAFAGGGIEHGVLLFADGRQQREKPLLNINVTGGAEAGAAAFGHDAVNAVANGGFHNGFAHRHVDLKGVSLVGYISYFRHEDNSIKVDLA